MRCLSNGPAQDALVVALLGLLHNLRCPSQLAPSLLPPGLPCVQRVLCPVINHLERRAPAGASI